MTVGATSRNLDDPRRVQLAWKGQPQYASPRPTS